MLVRFGRWSYCLKTLKIKIPFKKSFTTYMSLYSMDITPGQGWQDSRWLHDKQGGKDKVHEGRAHNNDRPLL